MPRLCLSAARSPGTLRIAVMGPLDRGTAAGFTEHALALIGESSTATTSVVLDLRCCTNMDADGADALDRIQQAVENQAGVIRLHGVPSLIEHLVRRPDP